MLNTTTLQFLTNLNDNNNRDWFHEHKMDYNAAKENVLELTAQIITNLAEKDASFASIVPNKCLFRIYRDVRFSKDKTPYKPHFGIVMVPGGRKSTNAGFYLRIKPNGHSFWAGGAFQPDSKALKAIRQEIDYNGQEFKTILENTNFKKHFPNLSGDSLITTPRGYSKDHTYIEYLRYKSYIVTKSINDSAFLKKNFITNTLKIYDIIRPFNNFLNKAMYEL